MREAVLDKPVTALTLRELVETFQEVIRREQEHYLDDEGFLAFSTEKAYAEYLDIVRLTITRRFLANFLTGSPGKGGQETATNTDLLALC